MSPDGNPVSFGIALSRIDHEGFKDEGTADAGTDGRFTFMAAPGREYRISLAANGMKTASKRVDTSTEKDIDLGDIVFKYCPNVSADIPKPPTTPDLIGNLKPEQIFIEPQPTATPSRSVFDLPPSTFKPDNTAELPPCWPGPSLDKRREWESFPGVRFDRYLTIESFVGGQVKSIRVVRYDPKFTPSQIREEVRKVWLGSFWLAASSIGWQEGNAWNILVSVEYEDGKQTSILMDGGVHVEVEDREGKYWFIRLWPAVD